MNLGIIGGSGLYQLDGLEHLETIRLATPFGAPSDEYIRGRLGGCEIFFLPRHGRGHRLLPAEINHRANIFGFKQLGVERIVSVSAVGSLRAELRPRDLVLPDQYYDRTKKSQDHTFFGNGLVAHVALAEPVCPDLRGRMFAVIQQTLASHPGGLRVQNGGTYVCMEGPAFSTKAESRSYRQLGGDVIGMTSLGEAKLCREAEICYAPLALVTDYDCWHAREASVTVEMIIGHLAANTALARDILLRLIPALPAARACACGTALQHAIITDRAAIPPATRAALQPLIGRYLA